MSAVSFGLMWGPGLIGMIVGLALYGVEASQFIFYTQAFPRDKLQLKILVLIVFIFDSTHTFVSVWFYYRLLVECRLKASPNCVIYVPPLFIFAASILYWITFTVQSFYAHRVWIISGQNRFITSAVILSALAQLVLGLLATVDSIRTPTFQALYSTKFLPLAAVASAVCDAIITVSIMYYLRPMMIGVAGRGNYIKKLSTVFIQMGLFSFINTSAVVILYYIQDGGSLLTAAPSFILSKVYVNSMLGVLNARKPIREERAEHTIEIPAIPTII